ncbi:thermonuclease family protein [Methylobacterium sp.]|uniref:thermonuclease family protein n=1 Tax=Methylobacterium sp. TaxID=409 RepID=UPI0025E00724|nr:thermonuclease family protein [Methylobacterium sp.]
MVEGSYAHPALPRPPAAHDARARRADRRPASVTDGDTIEIGRTKIRLHGIDVPEGEQVCQNAAGEDYPCGRGAALALSDRIDSAPISCAPRDTDRYGRIVAVCRKGSEDLNAWMVSQGHAVAFRRYAEDYVAQEAEAKAAKRGIWASTFQEPSAWRREKRAGGEDTRPASASPDAAANCKVKGNIGGKGTKIYHMPGTRDYERTRINEAKGERWFCSPVDAEKDGWRPAEG